MELWDLYDENRIKTGKTKIRGDKFEDGEYHIVIHLFIFNEKNELLIQQRAEDKYGWPSRWDVTVGGSALSGETSAEALYRECLEEIGYALPEGITRPHFTINFKDGFDDFYVLRVKDIDLSTLELQKEEVQAVRWASKDEVLELFDKEEFVPFNTGIIKLGFDFSLGKLAHTHVCTDARLPHLG